MDYVPLKPGEQIKKLAAGGNHTILLTTLGRVWSAGTGEGAVEWDDGSAKEVMASGQVGEVAHREDRDEQRRIGWTLIPWTGRAAESSAAGEADTNAVRSSDVLFDKVEIVDIAATFSSSLLLTATQQILTYGTGHKGELGLGPDITSASTPRVCFDLREFEPHSPETYITHLSACMSHIVAASSSGSLYGWGAGRRGQLGESMRVFKIVWIPRALKLDLQSRIECVATGREFTYIVGRREGGLKQWFLGDKDRIGVVDDNILLTRTQEEEMERAKVNGKQYDGSPCKIYAGWTSLSTLSSDGTIHAYGKRRHASGKETAYPHITRVKSLAVGSEHSVALTNNGDAIAWGWGEHGNCGEDVDEKGNVTGVSNVIFNPDKGQVVTGVAAGCATTFFWVEEQQGRDEVGNTSDNG